MVSTLPAPLLIPFPPLTLQVDVDYTAALAVWVAAAQLTIARLQKQCEDVIIRALYAAVYSTMFPDV